MIDQYTVIDPILPMLRMMMVVGIGLLLTLSIFTIKAYLRHTKDTFPPHLTRK